MPLNPSSRPARQVCPLCTRDQLVVESIGPGVWRYTCTNRRHAIYSWQGTATDRVDDAATEDKAGELGLYEDLPRCLEVGEPFVEYGVVEYRYSELRPAVYDQLIADYSHTRIEPKHFTASVFIALALGRLAKRGELLYRSGPATGYWKYNDVISYWALPPRSLAESDAITWERFASNKGIDPLS